MSRPRDPLLAIARLIIVVFIGGIGLAAGAIAIAAPVVWFTQDTIVARFAAEGHPGTQAMFPALPFVMLGIAGLLALGVWFLVLLRRIVASVGEGDPFVPANADRLSRMGWLVLAGQVVSIPIGTAVVWVATIVSDDKNDIHVGDDFGFDGGSILLMLVLFILARVFRQGAAMREDLEGTV